VDIRSVNDSVRISSANLNKIQQCLSFHIVPGVTAGTNEGYLQKKISFILSMMALNNISTAKSLGEKKK
jgi:hypothetical protein